MYISVCYSDQESVASVKDRHEGVGGRCQAHENLGQTRGLQKGDVQGQHCSHMKDMSNMHVCTCANDKLSHVLTAYGRVVVTVCSCMLRQRYSPPDHTRCNAALCTLVLCARSGAHSALSAQ